MVCVAGGAALVAFGRGGATDFLAGGLSVLAADDGRTNGEPALAVSEDLSVDGPALAPPAGLGGADGRTDGTLGLEVPFGLIGDGGALAVPDGLTGGGLLLAELLCTSSLGSRAADSLADGFDWVGAALGVRFS